MSLRSAVTITTAGVNTATVVTVEMSRSCILVVLLMAVIASVSHWHSTACLFLLLLLLFVLWMEVVDVKPYILQERGNGCPDAEVSVLYGLSFMVAAAGVPLELVSGLVFMMVGRALHASKWGNHVALRRRVDWPCHVLHWDAAAHLRDVNTGRKNLTNITAPPFGW